MPLHPTMPESRVLSKFISRKTIPLTITLKGIKYLGINLTKGVQNLYKLQNC